MPLRVKDWPAGREMEESSKAKSNFSLQVPSASVSLVR